MSRYLQRDGRTYTRDGFPVCHHRYDFAVGRVEGSLFIRANGFAPPHVAPGQEFPLVHLVAAFKAKRRGRPGKRKAEPGTLHTDRERVAYGLCRDGRWWSVLFTPGQPTARARTLAKPPYDMLRQGGARGMRADYGHTAYLAIKAREALDAAELEQARASDPHGLI